MFSGADTIHLDLSDMNMRIHIELEGYDFDAIDDHEKRIQFQYRKNIIPVYYNYTDSDGNWGSVDEHYITTMDIEHIANGVQEVLYGQLMEFKYQTVTEETTGEPFLVLFFQKVHDLFSMHVKVAEGRFCEWLIVELENLSFEQMEYYAQAFSRWKQDRPILSEDQLAIAKEIPW